MADDVPETENVALYFLRQKVLTKEQAYSAGLYVEQQILLESDQSAVRQTTRPIRRLDKAIRFDNREAAHFINWVFMNGLQNHPILSRFIMRIVKDFSIRKAAILNRRTERKFRRKGLEYFRDTLPSHALSILYGGSFLRIIKVEKLTRGPFIQVEERTSGGRFRNRATTLINDQYKVIASRIVRDELESEIGRFVVLREHMLTRRVWRYSALEHDVPLCYVAIGIAMRNFVALEAGRLSLKADELIAEHRDSRRSRSTDWSFDVHETSKVFAETNEDLTDLERAILLAELQRDTVREVNAYKHYKAVTSDDPHEAMYYKVLHIAKTKLANWFADNY